MFAVPRKSKKIRYLMKQMTLLLSMQKVLRCVIRSFNRAAEFKNVLGTPTRSRYVKIKVMLRLLLICLIAALSSFPQANPKRPAAPPPAQPASFAIRSISVEGNRNYSVEQVLRLTGLKVGETGGQKAFEAARDRLIASGAFETVGFRYGPSGDGYSVVFEVAEIQQVYPFMFEYINVPEAEIRAWLKQNDPLYTDKIPGTKEWIARYSEMIEGFLRQKGSNEKITGDAHRTVRTSFTLCSARGEPCLSLPKSFSPEAKSFRTGP